MRITDSMPKWVTCDYISACDARDHHFRIYSRNRTEANRAVMKHSRNYATKLKNDLKRDYFSKCLRDNKGDPKGLWKR